MPPHSYSLPTEPPIVSRPKLDSRQLTAAGRLLSDDPGVFQEVLLGGAWRVVLNTGVDRLKGHRLVEVDEGRILLHVDLQVLVQFLALVEIDRLGDRGQHLVAVEGQTDIVTMGLPYICPYNVDSIMNPILVACLGLGYFFNMYRGKPLVREGGVLIMSHPTPWEFHPVHHPSYIDFFEEVLADTKDPHYRKMLEIIRAGRKAALANPRIDMPGADPIAGSCRYLIPPPVPETAPVLQARVDRDGPARLRPGRSRRRAVVARHPAERSG